MIFSCFAGKDRYKVSQSLCYHLKNFGINVWYDFDELFLGDNGDEVNFEGIYQSMYAIVIISESTFYSSGAIAEIKILKNLYSNNKITVLPILYNIRRNEIPSEYKWIETLIYASLTRQDGTYNVALQIIAKVLKDLIQEKDYYTIEQYYGKKENSNLPPFIMEGLKLYEFIDNNNYNARIAVLYMMYKYIELKCVESDIELVV